MAFSKSVNKILKYINLPLLSSIGIHGLLFTLILPKWNPSEDLSNNRLQNTSVIELNQLEQTRIPNQNPNNTFNWNILNSLPENNDQSLALNIPNSSVPELQVSPLPFPLVNNSGVMNNLPSLPPLPPPPTSFYNSNPSNLPLPNYQIDSSTQTQLIAPPNIQEEINQEIISNLPDIKDLDLPINNQQITTRIRITPEEEAKIRQKLFGDSPIQITANPRDVINRRNPDPKINNTNEKNVINKSVRVNPLPQNHQSLTNQLKKNSDNTSDEEARKNYVAWATEVKNVQSKQINLNGTYPKDACIRKLEGTTTYGVTVNPQGTVIGTKLIKSSGYNLFNNQALTQIKNYKFANKTGNNQPYHVYVNFKYSNKVCPSISINNLGNIPAKKSPNQQTPSPSPTNNQEINNQTDKTKIKSVSPQESTDQSTPKNPSSNKEQTKSSSNINLPNMPNNKANMLVIPTTPSEPIKSVENNKVKSSSSSSESQASPLTPKAIEKTSSDTIMVEPSNNKPTAENSDQTPKIK